MSVLNSDLHVVDGRLVADSGAASAGDLFAYGIPRYADQVPVTPEMAVRLAAEDTGALVAAVPELHMPALPLWSGRSRWQVLLDRRVRLAAVGAEQEFLTDTVFVGVEPGIKAVSLSVADPSVNIQILDFGDGQVELRRRSGGFLAFIPVIAVR